ncbi:MAG: hypothetical protein MK194_14975 [Roseibacillus sp.]|nr:hypothetical protein [Roseibacillus sp.]
MNKYVIWAVAIILSFFIGRVMYLPLSGSLLAGGTESGTVSQSIQEVRFGVGSNELRIKINLGSIKEAEMPRSVTLTKRVDVSSEGNSQKTALEKGTTVQVRKMIKESYLLDISPGGPLTGVVPIAHTDFAQQVIAYRARRHFGGDAAIADNTPPSPVPPPTLPEVADNTAPKSDPAPSPAPNPDPAPSPAPQPEPEPEPEPTAEPASLNAEQIVAAMQESVKGGGIKEFKFEQVEGWKAGEEENVDGEMYQTGLAAYKAQTIFGEKVVQAKALIQKGKVVKWIYAKTGMEIR